MSQSRLIFVWLPDEEVHGVVIQKTPYWSRVKYVKHGITHVEIIPEEDIVYLKEVDFTEEGAAE